MWPPRRRRLGGSGRPTAGGHGRSGRGGWAGVRANDGELFEEDAGWQVVQPRGSRLDECGLFESSSEWATSATRDVPGPRDSLVVADRLLQQHELWLCFQRNDMLFSASPGLCFFAETKASAQAVTLTVATLFIGNWRQSIARDWPVCLRKSRGRNRRTPSLGR